MSKIIDKHIVRETEKAVCLWVLTLNGEKNVWFPRSQITINEKTVELTDWIARVKQEEYGYICPVPARELEAAA